MGLLLIIAFFIGVVMLIKGDFRFYGRLVSRRDGRLAGLVLMAPMVLEMCIAFSMSFSLVSNSMVTSEDGSVSISSQVFEDYLNQMMSFELLFVAALVGAVVVVGMIIWRSPQVNAPPASAQPAPFKPPREHPLGGFGMTAAPAPKPVAAPPAIMTVAEAAAYLRVTPADIDRLIDQGKLPAARSAGGFRIARSAIDDMVSGDTQH